ncbi:30s ribosomal protein s18 [Holotrichia oblita]|uniref:30s ribosomal protein s18 n=2 Tax=Holotrichia oblita TaxID=644536 RepID=A0ACB9T5N9_HOLOL|nr:30s ribosomal protein s18 [Holotrichia oblita]KAI4462070.1 30s ribosomal protein s18 [Holotrichia oblita]
MKHLFRNFIASLRRSTAILSTKYTTGGNKIVDNDPIVDIENPFEKEKPQCILCKTKIVPNYKNVQLLSQFQSPYTGRIYGRHITGLCKYQQEKVEKEIVKAQSAGLMATYLKDPQFFKDPKLFDPEKPLRPHQF